MDGLDGAVDRRLHFGLHLHRFGDQHGLAGLDLVALFHQHIDDVARHGGADIARRAGLFALVAGPGDELVEWLEHHFFRHAIQGQVEVALAVGFHAHAGDVDAVGFAVHVDDELGRYAFARHRAQAAEFRSRQQHFRSQSAGSTLFEELAPDVGEHRVGQHVLFGLGQQADFFAQLGHFRLDQVGRAHVDDVFVADRLLAQLLVDLARRAAVATLQVELHFVGDGLVALTGEDVEHRLAADDLRSRRHQRREAQVFTHPWNLGKHFVDAVQGALLFELVGQVGHHAARHLVDLHAGVHGGELAFKLVVLLAHGIEVQADFLQQFQVQASVVFATTQGGDHRLGAGVAGAPGEAGDGGVDMGRAVLDRLHLAHRG